MRTHVICISDAAHRTLLANAFPLQEFIGSRRLPNGRWRIEVDEEVLRELRRLDKDMSKAVLKACENYQRRRLS